MLLLSDACVLSGSGALPSHMLWPGVAWGAGRVALRLLWDTLERMHLQTT